MFKKLYWQVESIAHEILAKFLLPTNLLYKFATANKLTNQVIINLTSYPPRFNKIHLTIKTLLAQSYKADKLILWIAHKDKEQLPEAIIKLERKYQNFEIRFCDDLRSYKKIIPALLAFPNEILITADDDVYYSHNWLKTLIANWNGNNNQIVAYRTHKVALNDDGTAKPYNGWQHCCSNTSNCVLFPTGSAGILYPSGSLNSAVTDHKTFMDICQTADDVWLFWMGQLNNTTIKKTQQNFNIVNWPGTNDSGLAQSNVLNNQNDIQIKALENKYGLLKVNSN